MKLFATRSVANNFLGFSRSSDMIFPFDGWANKVSSMSFWDKENSATSAPDTMAEQKSKTNMPTKPTTKSVSML